MEVGWWDGHTHLQAEPTCCFQSCWRVRVDLGFFLAEDSSTIERVSWKVSVFMFSCFLQLSMLFAAFDLFLAVSNERLVDLILSLSRSLSLLAHYEPYFTHRRLSTISLSDLSGHHCTKRGSRRRLTPCCCRSSVCNLPFELFISLVLVVSLFVFVLRFVCSSACLFFLSVCLSFFRFFVGSVRWAVVRAVETHPLLSVVVCVGVGSGHLTCSISRC